MPSKQMERMTPAQRLDLLCKLWAALDVTGQTVLVRIAWALATACDGEDVKALGQIAGLLAPDNSESPEANTATG